MVSGAGAWVRGGRSIWGLSSSPASLPSAVGGSLQRAAPRSAIAACSSSMQHAVLTAWWCRHVHARGSLPFLIKLAYTAEPAAQQLQSVSRPLQAVYLYGCTAAE